MAGLQARVPHLGPTGPWCFCVLQKIKVRLAIVCTQHHSFSALRDRFVQWSCASTLPVYGRRDQVWKIWGKVMEVKFLCFGLVCRHYPVVGAPLDISSTDDSSSLILCPVLLNNRRFQSFWWNFNENVDVLGCGIICWLVRKCIIERSLEQMAA